MSILKFEEFKSMNESANAKVDLKGNLLQILQNASEHINGKDGKKGCMIVKDNKKMKLVSTLIDPNKHEPRYKKTDTAPANITASANKKLTPSTNAAAPASAEPIKFVFATDANAPIAEFSFTVANKDIQMTNKASKDVMHFNKMNMKYIPDSMQEFIENKVGKIEAA